MENYTQNLLGALHMLRTALKDYDVELAHNILIGGGTDQSEEEMEQDLEDYICELNELIEETWTMEKNNTVLALRKISRKI